VGLADTPMRIASSAFTLPLGTADLETRVALFLDDSFKKLNAQMEAVPYARDLAAQPGGQSFY
jgi:hypothetical protein